jgi:D-tyrosyl-tRNA(Tyr) deacylase
MIGLLQRVSRASVAVQGVDVGAIGAGLLVLLCAERGDTVKEADRLLRKLLAYRVFSDAAGKMNLSLTDTGGGLLLVPQFTLAADTNSGTRPSFQPAAAPADGKRLFDYFVERASALLPSLQTGRFGADMQVSLTNNGPVTFWLRVAPAVMAPSAASAATSTPAFAAAGAAKSG